jgi:dTDP-4-dehydrorhamnose 3,5-epimerase
MRITATHLPDVLLIEPKVFGDDRGYFFESFSQKLFEEAVGSAVAFVQDNHSLSQRGVLRGLHYQMPPHAQGKLVRVVEEKCLTSQLTYGVAHPTSANGSACI